MIPKLMSTSKYSDDLLNIDNPYFKGMVSQIYPAELQLNKANTSDTEASFFRFTFIYFKRICFYLKSMTNAAVHLMFAAIFAGSGICT